MDNLQPQKPKKRNGCIGCIWALGVVFLIFFGYQIIKYFIDLNNFKNGEEAFSKGDCTLAIEYYKKTQGDFRYIQIGLDDNLITQKLAECTDYQEARDDFQNGNYANSFKKLIAFKQIYPQSGLTNYVDYSISNLLSGVQISKLIDIPLCDDLPREYIGPERLPEFLYQCSLIYQKNGDDYNAYRFAWEVISNFPYSSNTFQSAFSNLSSLIPACTDYLNITSKLSYINQEYPSNFLYQCSKTFLNANQVSDEISVLEYLLTNYPKTTYYEEAKNMLIDAYFSTTNSQNSQTLNPPSISGYTYSNSAKLIVINATPETLRIILRGPTYLFEEIKPCTSCKKFSGIEPTYCPSGIEAEYELEPGKYDALVQTITNTGIIPYSEKMDLAKGYEYTDCFYIFTTVSP